MLANKCQTALFTQKFSRQLFKGTIYFYDRIFLHSDDFVSMSICFVHLFFVSLVFNNQIETMREK